jgi:hypothetical protein
MSEESQARASRRAPETEVSVDLSESDPNKAVTRRSKPANDIAAGVRDNEDGKRYSPSERKMFTRMTNLQKNLTRQFDQKLADQEARHQQELTEIKKRYEGVSVERGSDQEAATAHEKAMKALEEQLAAANEKGDSVAAARITAEMIKADGAYHAKLSGSRQRADTAAPGTAQGQTPQARKPAATGPTPAGSRFILANEDWWEDPDFEIEKQAASALYIKLVNEEGFDNNSDETFKEVARRLKDKFKDLPVVAGRRRGGDEEEPDAEVEEGRDRGEGRRRAPTGNMQDRGSAQGQRNNGSRRILTEQERKTMISVNLNPDNDRDLVQFLREASAMEASA